MKKLFFILYSLPLFVFAQQSKIDSLLTLLKKDREDTGKAIHSNNLSKEYFVIGSYDSCIAFANKALKLSEQLNPPYKKGLANAYNNLGNANGDQGDYPKELDYYFKALKIFEELKDKSGIGKLFGNIGHFYIDQADYSKALDYYFKALKIFEELGNKNLIAIALGNIGVIYANQADYPKALDYYFKELKMAQELRDKNLIANDLSKIGNVYTDQGDYPKALDYYFKSLKMIEEGGYKSFQANTLNNIGIVYFQKKDYSKALDYHFKSLKMAEEIGAQDYERQLEELLSDLYSKTNRYQLALEHYKKAMVLKDTLFSAESKKQLVRKEMNYEFDKKEEVTKAEHDAETKQQKIVIWSVIGGLLLVIVFAGFIFRSLRVARKQKKIIELKSKETEAQKKTIEEQKHVVEEKNKDITDSINYAKRIQRAMLPHRKDIWAAFPQSFVLFKPKDIVSGDFYWANVIDNKFVMITADCTGHGVPGAFMSLLNIGFLVEAINEKGIEKPNLVLNHVRQRLIDNISKEEQKDGFDGPGGWNQKRDQSDYATVVRQWRKQNSRYEHKYEAAPELATREQERRENGVD